MELVPIVCNIKLQLDLCRRINVRGQTISYSSDNNVAFAVNDENACSVQGRLPNRHICWRAVQQFYTFIQHTKLSIAIERIATRIFKIRQNFIFFEIYIFDNSAGQHSAQPNSPHLLLLYSFQ